MSKAKIKTKSASPLVFFVIAIIPLSVSLPKLISGMSSTSWPTTQGEVLNSVVDSKGDRIYKVIVTYDYEIYGQKFSGDTLSYDSRVDTFRGRQNAQPAAQKYEKGKTVTVHYKPEHPEKSTLVPGYRPLDLVLTVIGGLLFLGGLSVLLKTGSLRSGINS